MTEYVAENTKNDMMRNYQEKLSYRLIMPLQHFINQEKSGGIVLGISIVIALVLANSPLSDSYFHFFEQEFGFLFNGAGYFNFDLHHWINDGLMSMFFFVVGLELKREFIGGELADVRNTILPIGAAVFGMIVPALIYYLFNPHGDVSGGWGIPMATDIAFSLAILYVLGDRVPLSIKVFLTTLAIVDDLGAVLVIAFFYTSDISLLSIGVGVAFLMVMYVANRLGVKNVIFYGVVGICGVWTAFLMSGIHATIAAVLAAFMIPADARISEPKLHRTCRQIGNLKGREQRELADDHPVKQIYEKRLNTINRYVKRGTLDADLAEVMKKLAKDKMLRALSNVAYAKGDYEKEMGQAALKKEAKLRTK